MRRAVIGASLFLIAHSAAFGQVFEVASVKPSGPQSIRGWEGGPGSKDPERYSFGSVALEELITRAYGLTDYQQVSDSGWLPHQSFDLAVKVPPGTNEEQFQKMLQNLLIERFKLVVHHETREFPVYDLVAAKNGPKLKESAATPAPAPETAPPGGVDKDGFPILPPGRPGAGMRMGPGQITHWRAQQQPIATLANMLRGPTAAGRVVIDKTGLTGRYDFTLYYDMRAPGLPPSTDDDPAPILADALQQQLGLKLVEAKAPFDVIVIDHAEKVPTEN